MGGQYGFHLQQLLTRSQNLFTEEAFDPTELESCAFFIFHSELPVIVSPSHPSQWIKYRPNHPKSPEKHAPSSSIEPWHATYQNSGNLLISTNMTIIPRFSLDNASFHHQTLFSHITGTATALLFVGSIIKVSLIGSVLYAVHQLCPDTRR